MVEYVNELGENVRKRHCHETKKGKVISFVVQLEVYINEAWKIVIRYDSAHGYAHIDRYYLDGRKEKKDLNLNFSEALTLADRDIKINWENYKNAFIIGK